MANRNPLKCPHDLWMPLLNEKYLWFCMKLKLVVFRPCMIPIYNIFKISSTGIFWGTSIPFSKSIHYPPHVKIEAHMRKTTESSSPFSFFCFYLLQRFGGLLFRKGFHISLWWMLLAFFCNRKYSAHEMIDYMFHILFY